MKHLAIFDLDNTLLEGDSDYAWGTFIANQGLIDPAHYMEKNTAFYQDYLAGQLDIHAYQYFVLSHMAAIPHADRQTLLHGFVHGTVLPMIRPKALTRLAQHQQQGHVTLIMTATNYLIAKPIADYLAVDQLIATDVEIINNKITGRIAGTPCFQDGKVKRLHDWQKTQHDTFSTSYFYSDSANDIPLLEAVDKPIAVTPDQKLQSYAEQRGWEILDFSHSCPT